MLYYNPLDTKCKSITGAVPSDTEITFSVCANAENCTFAIREDGSDKMKYFPLEKSGEYFSFVKKFKPGIYWYTFLLDNGYMIGLGEKYTGILTFNPVEFQLSVYDKNYSVPNWLSGGIIYQIFPDRFMRADKEKQVSEGKILHDNWEDMPVFLPNSEGKVLNNDFFGGDFNGIRQKLSYLKDLGVTCIYLNPIFKAYSNHRYDTGDYMHFDELLGTEEDFRALVKACKKSEIKIILDGVFNHCGDDSVYFNKYGHYESCGAYNDKNSPYVDWFNFIDYPQNYKSWWGITTLPTYNKTNEELIRFITGKNGVLEKYLKLGINGWRLDVVDELPAEFVKEIRKAVKSQDPEAIIIGEVWEDASNKISYGIRRHYFEGEELDSVMNYPLKDAILDFVQNSNAKFLAYTIKEQIDHYPKKVLDSLMNILSTHDTYRLLSAVSEYSVAGKTKEEMSHIRIGKDHRDKAIFNLKVASLLQYTLYGTPSLYYGDEAGMEGYTDPLNRKCYPWGKEDSEILSWYKKLGRLRSNYSVFKDGIYREIYEDKGFFAFERKGEDSEFMVAINLSNVERILNFEEELLDVLSGKYYNKEIRLPENSFVLLIKEN